MNSYYRKIFIIFIVLNVSFSCFAREEFSNSALASDNLQLPYSNKYYDQETSFDSKVDTKKMDEIAEGPLRKLGRGIANIAFGAFEILIQPYEINKKEGGISALTYGVFRGVFFFIARVGVGVVDVVTFPIPLPGASTSGFKDEWGYGPLMQPEWVFDLDRNPYNFIYQNDPL